MPVPTDLSKLSNVVKNDVVKKAAYNKLLAKVNNIDTSDFVWKASTNKAELKKKIPDVSNLATKAQLNAVENKIPRASDFVTKKWFNYYWK